MVSPASFRHPSMLAKLATTADHVSGGRIELGMGTGWSEIEHSAYGFPFLSMKERMDVLEEQLAIVHDGHWGEGGFSFHGEHYTLIDLDARPKPVQRPHPPLIMGGGAGPRASRLAARYADEYNTDFVAPRRSASAGATSSPPASGPAASRSRSRSCPDCRWARMRRAGGAPARAEAWAEVPGPETGFVGTVEQVAARIKEYEAVGVSRVYLQHLLPGTSRPSS